MLEKIIQKNTEKSEISEQLKGLREQLTLLENKIKIAGMPVMASIAMMVTPSDSEYAMGGIFITTICSLVTLPLVCLILQ